MAGGYNKFGPNDIFYNRIKTYPQNNFFIYDSRIYYMLRSEQSGAYTDNVPGVKVGHISLHELNVDRNANDTGLITPYVYKTSNLDAFSAVTVDSFFSQYAYGDKIEGTYPMTSSIVRQRFASGLGDYTGSALQNTFDYYKPLSKHYEYSSSLLGANKGELESNLILVPSIFYGSSIRKGSINLKFFITGTLIGELCDIHKNGELVQVGPTGSAGSGSVAGVALYKEGFMYLTGNWDLYPENGTPAALDYKADGSTVNSSWLYFAVGANDGISWGDTPADSLSSRASASYELNFDGVNYVPTITMMAHAPVGQFNHSNNLTYLEYNQTASLTPETGTYRYIEKDLVIKNVVSSSYADPTGSFEKTTYISKVGIYDENKNLIGVASLATPVKKTQDREYTFKLKLDV